MAPSVFLLCILFSVGFLIEYSIGGISELEIGLGFKKEPQNVIGVKGKSLVLPCEPWASRTDARLRIAWFHNNEFLDLANDTRRQILSNGSLYFTKLINKKNGHGQTDQGEYRCVVVSQHGSLTSKTATLEISAFHAFTEDPSSETVEEGSNVRLFCSIESTPEASIVWEKGNLPLPQNNNKYAQVSGPGIQGSVLYIFNVSSNDTGRYRCSATNALFKKQRRSSSGLLNVKPRQMQPIQPSFTFLSSASPNLRTVKEGDDVTLDCVVNSFPMPTLIWSFVQNDEGKPKNIFNENQKLYSVKSGYNILAIKNVSRNQSGSYTCSAMNVSQSQTMTTILNVQTAPQFLEMPESKMFHAAKTVRFHCKVFGDPVPEVLWMKEGVPVRINGRIKLKTSVNETINLRSSELLVSSTVSNDSGIYQCVSKNSLGNIWAGSRLFLNASKPPPSAPEKVACYPLSSTQIDISWDIPDSLQRKDVKAFSIHHWTDGGEERLHPTGPEDRSSVVDKLLPFTNYTFSIRVYSDSASEFSEKVICQTGEEVPISAPDIAVESMSPNSIRVSWTPLPSKRARGIVTDYKVQWRIADSPSTKVVELTSDVLDYTITGLTPGKKYDIRVLAATSKGWPHLSLPWTTFEIPQKYSQNILSAPNVTLLAFNSSAIKIIWNVSSSENKLQGYKIFYRKQNSNQIGPIIVPANITEYLITDLDAETSYEIMVLGYTNNSEGETGTSSIHTLPEDTTSETTPHELVFVPEPPVGLEADPISSVAINLTWGPPKLPFGASKISYYTVCFNEVQTSLSVNASTINCLKSSKNQISVTDLKPFTSYEFKVRSHDVKERYSVYSQTLECLTKEDVPSEVLDVSWKSLNKTTVRVTWKEPLVINGLITNFTVSYSEDFNSPLDLWASKVVPGNKYSAELTNLQANVKYYVVVRGSTKAGFGLYKTPTQFIIPDKRSVMKTDLPKTSKDKHSDQYVGIIVGLAIGLSCIIICTLCIVCRRRCTKRQVPQDGGQTPGRHANGNGCQRSREHIPESHEMEYFTYLSSQTGRPDPTDITPQHLDTKGHYPNGFINGVRLSLLSDNRYPNGSFSRGSINITENPRYDPNSTDSPLLGLQSLSNSHIDNETTHNSSTNSGRLQDSNVPLLTGKRKFSDAEKSGSLSYEDSESEGDDSKKKSIKHSDKVQGFLSKNQGNEILQSNVEILKNNNKFSFGENYCNQRLNENGRCLNKNHVLENPEFRFSDSGDSDKKQIKRNGYLLTNGYGFCNGTVEVHRQPDGISTFAGEGVTNPQKTAIFKNTQSITNSVND